MRIYLFLLVLLFGTHGPLSAEVVPPAIQNLIDLGNKVTPLGEVHGLQSYMVEKGEALQVFYLAPDGKATIGGVMHDEKGYSVTRAQIIKHIESRAQEPANIVMNNAIHLGNSGPVLVAFVSPTCPHCAAFWNDIGQQILAGKLQVKALPVPSGVTTQEIQASKLIAARLLDDPDPAKAFIGYSMRKVSLPQGDPSRASVLQVEENAKLFSSFGFKSTPGFLGQTGENELTKAEGWPVALNNLLTKYNQH